MGEERLTTNRAAAAIQPSQLQSYTEMIAKMIVSLARFDDDGRAQTAANCLTAAKASLEEDFYPSERLATEDAEKAATAVQEVDESVSIVTPSEPTTPLRDPLPVGSPGYDTDGVTPLPPFTPPNFPTKSGEFADFGNAPSV